MVLGLTKEIQDVTHHMGPNGDPVPGGLAGVEGAGKKSKPKTKGDK